MKAAVYDRPGPPEVLRYIDVPDPACPAGSVLIRNRAIAIEGGDILHRKGTPPAAPNFIGGYASAGEIIAVGEGVTDRTVGQTVTSFDVGGSHAELRAVPAAQTWIVPDGLDPCIAAAIPIAFGTAHHCLFARGRLVAGETVLIQAGAGGVGVGAIQFAAQAGATVITTVSGVERAERLKVLGLTYAIDHRKTDLVEEVMRLTGGRGVDLVVDPVGATLKASQAALRPEGRLVFVGNAGGEGVKMDLWPAMAANQTLLGVYMGTQFTKPDVHPMVSGLLEQASRGEIEVVVDRTFPLSEAASAHAYIEENAILGRVLLIP